MSWDIQILAEVVSHHMITTLVTSGQVLRILLDGPWSVNADASLRQVVNVGGGMQVAVCTDIQRLLGDQVNIHNMYGCTESPCTTWTFQQASAVVEFGKEPMAPAGAP